MLVGVGNFGLQKGVAKFRVGLRYEKMLSLCSCLVPADRALEVVTLQTARRYCHACCTGRRTLPENSTLLASSPRTTERQAYCSTHCNRSRYCLRPEPGSVDQVVSEKGMSKMKGDEAAPTALKFLR